MFIEHSPSRDRALIEFLLAKNDLSWEIPSQVAHNTYTDKEFM